MPLYMANSVFAKGFIITSIKKMDLLNYYRCAGNFLRFDLI